MRPTMGHTFKHYCYCVKRNHHPHFTDKNNKTPKELSNLPKAKPVNSQLVAVYPGIPGRPCCHHSY